MRVGGHANIFPNSWVRGGRQLVLRVPRSPVSTEFWYFSFIDKNASEEQRRKALHGLIHVHGPAGLLEQEDGENWAQATRQTRGYISQHIPQQLKMNLGRGKIIKEHGLARIEAGTSEHAQLWTYLSWAQWMSGANWEQLRIQTLPSELL
jgi:3-phenylpropionate/trans-cinnamate dioxygenase alpha subunit